MDEEIIDFPEEERRYQNPILWWEKKRILFNVLVGISGLTCILLNLTSFDFYDVIFVFIWGVFANILYSTGMLLEIWNQYYLSKTFKLEYLRGLLFLIGTLSYCFVSFVYGWFYFTVIK